MPMTPPLRKLALTLHVAVSVGWLGAVVAYLALAIVGVATQDAQLARASYRSMAVVGPYVLVPLALATLLSGLVEGAGTRWGLLQQWWVLAKLVLTTAATLVLLRHIPAVLSMAAVATDSPLLPAEVRGERMQLVLHAIGGVLVLLTTTALSVFKPWGMTPFARRQEIARVEASANDVPLTVGIPTATNPAVRARAPQWVYVVWIHAIALGAIFVVLHLAGGGLRGH